MIACHMTDTPEDGILARSIPNPETSDEVLLKRGSVLSGRVLRSLRRMGFRSVWIEADGTEGTDSVLPEKRFSAQRAAVESIAAVIKAYDRDGIDAFSLTPCRKAVNRLLGSLREGKAIHCILDNMELAAGDINRHGATVSMLSLLIGMDLLESGGHRNEEAGLLRLGLGGLVHDIGKISLPEEQRHRAEWERSAQEQTLWQCHAVRGWQILKQQSDPSVAQMALWHHQHVDGSGYPSEEESCGADLPDPETIPLTSRIVAVADAYETLTGFCGYLPLEALDEMFHARRHHFHPKVLAALARVVPPFSPGSEIRLSSGHTAVVLDYDAARPFRPPVVLMREPGGQMLPSAKREALQLKNYPDLKIRSINGRRVEHLVPDDPAAMWGEADG